MMPSLQKLREFFQSDTVTILAGPEKQKFIIHQQAFKLSGSPSLKVFASDNWREATNRVVDWCHTDADTVSRVCTFLYTRDYEPPHPSLIVAEASIASEVDNDDDGTIRTAPTSHTQAEEELSTTPLPQGEVAARVVTAAQVIIDRDPSSISQEDTDLEMQQTILHSLGNRSMESTAEFNETDMTDDTSTKFDITRYLYARFSYTEILLAHARLHTFAMYHLYPALTDASLSRINETLSALDCAEHHAVGEVAALVRFVYQHEYAEGNKPDPLRKVTSDFVAANFTLLARDEIATTLALGGDFASDVFRKLSGRLREQDKLIKKLRQENADLQDNSDLHAKVRSQAITEEPVDSWDSWGPSIRRRARR